MNTTRQTELLAWSDALVLGFGPIDTEHEEFVELVRALQQAADEALPALLDAFETHAQAHFGAEDQWMVETDFPARECHMNEHTAVLATVRGVRAKLWAGDCLAARRLADELARWFPGHAAYLDSALAHWMCKRSLGGKPVVLRRSLQMP